MITDWDDAYDNSGHVPGSAEFGPKWEAAAAAFRAALGTRAETDIPYGPAPRQRYDLFHPEGSPRGLVVFVHGGYWRARARSDWSHLAEGPLARGWAVAMPGYTLCPEATIPDIRDEVARAVTAAAGRIAGPIRLAGHSAGGHLVTRLLCTDVALPVTPRIVRTVSISGVHDLRPLLRTRMNADLRLDMETATAESPALLVPRPGTSLVAWVGSEERPEFLRQAALLANVWTGLGAEVRPVTARGLNHFTVVEDLARPRGPLVTALLGQATSA